MKVKIQSQNDSQQRNVITKCRGWGAASRDGDYGPVAGKTAVVVNTKLGGGTPAIQLSDVNYRPEKNPYDLVISYKDFMNTQVCPWNSAASIGAATVGHVCPEPQVIKVAVPVEVEVETGVCSQDTLTPTSCDVLTQDPVAWSSLGLPFLQDRIDVTMDNDIAYVINVRKNTAKPLTPKSAAKKAKKDLLAGQDSVWVEYAKAFHLFENVVLTKNTEEV